MIAIPIARLRCLLRIGGYPVSVEAWVDTASPLTLFPQDLWRKFESDVEWLTVPPGQPALTGLVGGGQYPIRFGRVMVTATSSDLGTVLPPMAITAMFPEDNGKLGRTLVGLWGGILTGRRLRVEPDLTEAWIEDPGP